MWHVHLKQVIRHSSECFNLQVSPLLCHSVNIFAWLHCWSIRIAKGVGILGCSSPLVSLFLAKNLQYSGGKHWRALCSTQCDPSSHHSFEKSWLHLWRRPCLQRYFRSSLILLIYCFVKLSHISCDKEWCNVLSYLFENHWWSFNEI